MLNLKPEDRPESPDLQATVIEVMERTDELVGELERLRDLMTRWGTDPTGVCRRAQPRTVELHEQAGKLRELVTALSQGYRRSGAFSAVYGDVGGM